MNTLQLSGVLIRRFNTNYAPNGTRLASFFEQCGNKGKFGSQRKRIGLWVREQGVEVAKACTRQFEFIAAQRVRRTLQIFHLYTRLWDEVALKEFIKSWRYRAIKNTRHFLMSAVGVTMYNWESERISDAELNRYKYEIEGIHKLKNTTVVCAKCHLRIKIDNIQSGINYCACYGKKSSAQSNQGEDGWRPYIEREDMLIWRRVEPESGGLFAYKVYGSFADVSADDFLQVQIDVDYRKQWDSTARELHIIDTDPKFETSVDNSSDVIYWEMIWPRLFSNRDYVYQRRWIVDREKGIIIIISKVTDHPEVPAKPGIHRVTTYWSYMVIRPYTEFHRPGIEFGLTYFDDPGVNVLSAVTEWVAMIGLPDFLIRMRQASKNYQKYRITKKDPIIISTDTISLKGNDELEEKVEENNKSSANASNREISRKGQNVENHDIYKQSNEDNNTDDNENKDITSNSPSNEGFNVPLNEQNGKTLTPDKCKPTDEICE